MIADPLTILTELFPTQPQQSLLTLLQVHGDVNAVVDALLTDNHEGPFDVDQDDDQNNLGRAMDDVDEEDLDGMGVTVRKGKERVTFDLTDGNDCEEDIGSSFERSGLARVDSSIMDIDPSSQRSYKGKETVDLTDDNEQDAGPSFGVNGLGRTNSSIMDIDPSSQRSTQPATPRRASGSSSSSAAQPETPQEPEEILAEMFPDAHPDYLRKLLHQHRGEHAVEAVSEVVFAANGKYPKRTEDLAGKKRAREDHDDAGPSRKKTQNASDKELPHWRYRAICCEQLQYDFPTIPVGYIRSTLSEVNHHYTPAYLHLRDTLSDENPPYKKLVKGRIKGKKTVRFQPNPELTKEIEALKQKLAEGNHGEAEQMDVDDMGQIECGCCYCEYSFDKMTQCEDGHLFCMECARKAAENLIGLRKTEIKCLSSEGCEYTFPISAIKQFLSEKTFEGYMRLLQEIDLEKAGLSGLHSCPFCPYAAILATDPDEDKLFHCLNPDCKAVSCRICKKRNHAPLTCEEAKKDDVLDIKHQIEEAMTEALLRECPACKRKFYKEEGCNKMRCSCGQVMCYVCRKPVADYSHFENSRNVAVGGKCPLWDDTAKRNAEDVERAGRAAIDTAKQENPDVDEGQIKVHIVKQNGCMIAPPPPPGGWNAHGAGGMVGADAAAVIDGHLNAAREQARQLRDLAARDVEAVDAVGDGGGEGEGVADAVNCRMM